MRANFKPVFKKNIVLVGGGHSHIQVVKHWGMNPDLPFALTLIDESIEAVYSGMVPGFVAGQYVSREVSVNLVNLCAWAGVRYIKSRVESINLQLKILEMEDRPSLGYDLLSLNIGSTVHVPIENEVDGILSTRPIGKMVRQLNEFLEKNDVTGETWVLVGGGAAGFEMASCLAMRAAKMGRRIAWKLVHSGERILTGYSASARAAAENYLIKIGVEVLGGFQVESVQAKSLVSLDGNSLPFDKLIWAAGAAAPSWLKDVGLGLDGDGYIAVEASLRSTTHPEVFAAGDCAGTGLPKAGVYAVREGKILLVNLLRSARDIPALVSYRPQKRFLSLLNCGDGTAILDYGRFGYRGKAAFKLKDFIDRRFLKKFTPSEFESPEENSASHEDGIPKMWCGGCGSKFSGDLLREGLGEMAQDKKDFKWEDAAFLKEGDFSTAHTIDFLRVCLSDLYLFGRITAVHTLNDLDAMGSQARAALVVAVVERYARTAEGKRRAREQLTELLAGCERVLSRRKVSIIGGHTSEAEAVHLGLSLVGSVHTISFLKKNARPGQLLVLTKPLGTGVVLAAVQQGKCPASVYESAVETMLIENDSAVEILRESGVDCVTDVSGFGLVGHLSEILEQSGLSATLNLDALPHIPDSLDLLATGLRSSLFSENESYGRNSGRIQYAGSDPLRMALCADPQTAGGLLFTVEEKKSKEVMDRLRNSGYEAAAVIGEVESPRT